MAFAKIQPSTVVTVPDHESLLAFWRSHGWTGLVGQFVCEKPLTESQLNRLPKALKELL
jgi:hypothetical protein